MLVETVAEGSPQRRYAQNVLTAANRASGLVEQILSYSRSQRGKRVPVELDRIVAETLDLVRAKLAAGIALETRLPAKPIFVIGDPTQLHQIVMNLCTNAVHAIGESGTLRVTVDAEEVAAERAFAHTTLSPGSYARLAVEDSGTGMDATTLARLIAEDPTQAPLVRGNGERIMVVEDERPLMALLCEVLKRLGYKPAGFADGSAALAEFEARSGRFDALITDEIMPGLAGTELAAALRRQRADLPVVLVSGYIGPMISERAIAAGIREILKKPVQTRELAAALARALGRG
jgi:CheY-like chemotaxis protein